MKAKLSAVLFDLDGTLLDTAPDLATALNIVLAKHQRPTIPYEKIRSYSSTGSRGLLNLGFNIDEHDPQYKILREQFLDAYHLHINDQTEIFPGMEEVLAYIESLGLHWGVVTNKPAALAKQLLDYFDLSRRCACLVGGDTLAKRKPDPEPLLYACEVIGLTAQSCVYVGDAERDIEAAKQANMTSVAALYGYIIDHEKPENWRADYYIDQPQQIINWVEKRLKD